MVCIKAFCPICGTCAVVQREVKRSHAGRSVCKPSAECFIWMLLLKGVLQGQAGRHQGDNIELHKDLGSAVGKSPDLQTGRSSSTHCAWLSCWELACCLLQSRATCAPITESFPGDSTSPQGLQVVLSCIASQGISGLRRGKEVSSQNLGPDEIWRGLVHPAR